MADVHTEALFFNVSPEDTSKVYIFCKCMGLSKCNSHQLLSHTYVSALSLHYTPLQPDATSLHAYALTPRPMSC